RNRSDQPSARPILIYASTRSLERPEVAAFIGFYFEKAPSLVGQLGYVPLPQKAYDLGRERVDKRLTGSIFGGKGSQVGVSIDQLLERENAEATSPK
ncbi:MAG: protein sphX, partial [Deltaproteobacteria bacterium]|nr:protein sphX [Deltaproteobacteria bacterium]